MVKMRIPKGRIKQLITRRARQKVIWSLPGYAAFWAFIFLIPWEALMEENGAAPLAINAWNKLMNFGSAPVPWVSVTLSVMIVSLAISTFITGIKELMNPANHSLIKDLKSRGYDPAVAISDYEKGMDAEETLTMGSVSATPDWIFISGDLARLIPLSDLQWLHFKSDVSQGAVIGIFRAAGVISRRQAEFARDDSDVIALYFRDFEDPIEAESTTFFAQDIVSFLSTHNSEAVFGWDKSIMEIWKHDRENFSKKAPAKVQALLHEQKSSTGPASSTDSTVSDVIELGENLVDKISN